MADHEHGSDARSESDDDLMARLRRAAPHDPNPLPPATGPEARSLLESIMHPDSPEHVEPGSTPQLDPVLFGDTDAATGFAPPRIQQARRRNYGAVLAAAAALILIIGAAITFLPSNTEPALAAVQSAAQATAESDSGRIELSVDLAATDEGEAGAVAAAVDGRYDGQDLAFNVTSFSTEGAAGELEDEFGSDGLPVEEAIYVDGVFYTEIDPEGWIGVEVPEFVGTTVTDLADPRQVLTTVQDLVAATEVGPETIVDPSGVEVATTRYVSEVDLGEESLAEAGWMVGFDTVEIEADGLVTVAFNIDDDGLLRRLAVTGDLSEREGEAGVGGVVDTARFAIVTWFYDLGGDIQIDAPEDVTIIDPMEELEDGFGEGFEGGDGLFGDREEFDPEG